jgi:hypothetical protein
MESVCSATHRCLKRHGLNRKPKPDKPAVGRFEDAAVGFIHIDLKHLPALERRKSYAFVAIDRATRYVYLEIHPRRDAETAAGFLECSSPTSRIAFTPSSPTTAANLPIASPST